MASTEKRPISDLERAVAARLRSEIALQQVRKAKLAETVGVHRTHLSRVIHGHTHIDINLLGELCEALGLDVVEVLASAAREVRAAVHERVDRALAADDMRGELDEIERPGVDGNERAAG